MNQTESEPLLRVAVRREVARAFVLEASLELGHEFGIVFGASGSGKTTLLRLVAGLDMPDSGRIMLEGETLFDSEHGVRIPLRRRRIGMIFQDDLLFPHINVRRNIAYGLASWPRREAEARVQEVARVCGVDSLLERMTPGLSGGERQRVGLARAIALRPRLLLCDEPVSALDLASRAGLVQQLELVQRLERIPVLYVTHNPAEALRLGATAFVLDRGKLVATGSPLDVIAPALGFGPRHLSGVHNAWRGHVVDHDSAASETRVVLPGGVVLAIPHQDRPTGSSIAIGVRADEILLAKGPVTGLSARNQIAARVLQIVLRGTDAEIVVCAGDVKGIVSVLSGTVSALGLEQGSEVWLIIKARSIVTLDDPMREG